MPTKYWATFNCYQNSIDPTFEMRNASTSHQMLVLAIQSWTTVIQICEQFGSDSELQLCHLRVIPTYLLICGKLNKISQKATIAKVLQMLEISKLLYDSLSSERAQIFNAAPLTLAYYRVCPQTYYIIVRGPSVIKVNPKLHRH